MHQDAALAGNSRYVPHGLERADLVVGMHQRYEDGVRRHRPPDIVRIDLPVAIDRHDGDRTAPALECSTTRQGGRMLHGTGNDVALRWSDGMSQDDAFD